MKRLIYITGFLFLLLSISHQAKAQFLKKLADKVSERVENKMIDDTGDAAVKGVDQAKNETADAIDSEAKNGNKKIINHSFEEPKPWPEDYKLSLSGSGNGMFMEYRMKMDGDKEQSQAYSMNMNFESYVSPGKGTRSEANIQIPMMGTMSMVTLIEDDHPNRVTILNVRKKEYFSMDFSEGATKEKEANFTVTRLGEEELFGVLCIHSKAISDDGVSFEVWTTRALGNYEQMVRLYSTSKNMGQGNLWEKMRAKDCDGIMVKMKYDIPEQGTAVMQLFKIERTNVPNEMLQVPAGYKESDSRWVKNYMKK